MKADLETILSFGAVAEELSFSRAAARLNIDQSRVSRQVAALEARLGCALFNRTTRQVSLTEEGERLLRTVLPLQQAKAKVEAAMELLVSGRTHRVRIGVLFSQGADKRSQLFESFARRFPKAELVIQYGATTELFAGLTTGALDVIFANEPFDREGLEVLRFQRHPLMVLLPDEDPLAQLAQVPLDQLIGRKVGLIPRHIPPLVGKHIDEGLAAAGAKIIPSSDVEMAAIYHSGRANRICYLLFAPTEHLPPPMGGMVARWIDRERIWRDSFIVRQAAHQDKRLNWVFETARAMFSDKD